MGSQENASRLRLALVESQDLDHARSWHLPPDQYSNRASSLTPTSLSFLSQIGAWHLVDDSRVQAYHHMRVWDGLSSNSRISFDSPFSDHPIAYMTENQNLTKGLARRLDELSDISMFDKTNVEKISLGAPPSSESSSLNLSSYPHVTLSSKHTIAARLLVGADGNNSPVRKFAGIDTRGWDYNRHGIVATLKLSNGNKSDQALPRRRTAYQRFLPTGPVALLALPGDYATLVWTATPAQAAHLKSLSENDFIAMVNAAFRLQIVDLDFMFTIPSGQVDELLWRESVSPSTIAEENGEIPSTIESVQEGSRASFPLRLRQSKTYTTDRVALIGDAAHTIHPLAGQGLNMGLGDAKSLASSIDFAVKHGADIGNEISCLDQYNSDTWMSNNRMLGAVDKLHWLCAMKSSPVVGLRGLGLRVVDSLEPLKGWFMRQAGGL
ncbi:putative ubiquinone biosynthesis monooxygenase [Lecanora helva]